MTKTYNIGSYWREYDLNDEKGDYDIHDLEAARALAIDGQHNDTVASVIFDEDGIPIEIYILGVKFVPEAL